MSTVSRARYLSLAGLLFVGAAVSQPSEVPPASTSPAATNAGLLDQPAQPPVRSAAQANQGPTSVRPLQQNAPPAPSSRDRDAGLAYPPSPLQTAGAIVGALFAILLAIAGVTVTFRAMREERRGRGRRRSARSSAAAT